MVNTRALLDWLQAQLGKPYLWGGRGSTFSDGSPTPYEGWDCWGLVACAAMASGDSIEDLRSWWTDVAWSRLLPVATPSPGDLVFYAPASPKDAQDVEHVEVVVDWGGQGWRTIGAGGGDHTTTALEVARGQSAFVKYRANHLERPRFAGFRRLVIAVGERP